MICKLSCYILKGNPLLAVEDKGMYIFVACLVRNSIDNRVNNGNGRCMW